MSEPAIAVDNLHKTYRSGLFRSQDVKALQGVTFEVEKGSIFGLLGPNGAGKTTLIKVLLGLVSKTSGGATLLGQPAGSRVGRKRVGYLPESHRIPKHLTGGSALRYYGGLSGLSSAEIKQRAPDLLERVGLGEWAKMPVRKYSKGMQQRLGLAQAMLHRPELLILDEPTDGVDPVGRTEMRAILNELKGEGITIFINSHLLQEIELVCDQVAILVSGTIRRVGTVEEVRRRSDADIELCVAGKENDIQACLSELTTSNWEAFEDNKIRVTLPPISQSEINTVIDQLRSRDIDIVSLVRTGETLEDAFLDVVEASLIQ